MSRIFHPTKKECRADQLSPGGMLVLLILKHTGSIEEDHLADLAHEAIARCGSIKNAITALESGRLVFEKIS